MTRYYVDTSAAFKLIADEPEADELDRHLAAVDPELVSSVLLETELRRAAQRGGGPRHEDVLDLMDELALYGLGADDFVAAGLLPGQHLRALDALHLIAAIRCRADAVLTYDARMAASAVELGLRAVTPGRESRASTATPPTPEP